MPKTEIKNIKKAVKEYAKILKEKRFPFVAVYLFGSYAKGTAGKWSDIDVAVLSDSFGKNMNKSEEVLWKLGIWADSRIEPIGVTPDDFKKGKSLLASEIKKTGVRIE
jgi:predicted nucleotidyltransferase